MSAEDEWLKRARLRYVVETYFPGATFAYLGRRCRGDCLPAENARVSTHPILKVADSWHQSGERAVLTYFELSGPPLPPRFIDIVCGVMVREFAFEHGELSDIDRAARSLARYVREGEGSPYAILQATQFRMDELSFEHRLATPHSGLRDESYARRAVQFLRGGSRKDWDILREVAVARPVERELVDAVEGGAALIVFTGAAGDGKSTVLRRVGMALRKKGWRVFLADAVDRGPFPSLPRFAGPGLRTCLLVDNADMASSYPELERNLVSARDVHVILCARSYPWVRKQLRFARAVSVSIPALSSEIGLLADSILRWEAADQALTRNELISAMRECVRGDHPHLLAAMMTATRGKNFEAIIDEIIGDFEEAGEEWALQYVACGALISDMSGGVVGRLPGTLFQRLVAARDSGSVRKLREFASEILPLRSSLRYDPTEYDLRHPDISRRVLQHYFGLRWGCEVSEPMHLADRLCDIFQAEFDVVETRRRGESLGRLHYSERAAKSLMQTSADRDRWFPVSISREVMRALLAKYGGYVGELYMRIGLLMDWADRESRLEEDKPDESGARLSDRLFEEARSLNSNAEPVRTRWADAAQRRGDSGDWVHPAQYSARWIFREAWQSGLRTDGFVAKWCAFEMAEGRIGEGKAPESFSARWIAREAWAAGVRGRQYISLWLSLEERAGDLPAARTIARDAWTAGERDVHFVIAWMQLEEKAGDLPAARTIARDAWTEGARAPELVIAWMQLEEKAGDLPAGRTIARDAWTEGARAPELVIAWMQLEGKAGDLPAARTMARDAWTAGERDAHFVIAWMQLEEKAGDLPAARTIARDAWTEGARAPELVIAWMQLEEKAGDLPAARTMARDAWTAGERDARFVIAWMQLEERLGNVGGDNAPSEFSAHWLGQVNWQSGGRDPSLAHVWSQIERRHGNIGEFGSPAAYSARWILRNVASTSVAAFRVIAPSLIALEYEEPSGVVGTPLEPIRWSGRELARELWSLRSCSSTNAWHLARLEFLHGELPADEDHPYSPQWYFSESRRRFGVECDDVDSWMAATPATLSEASVIAYVPKF